jgi:DUF4097 and DUF4098 domain-containing protein YvlB
MEEERLLILRMVEEGKITAEEAIALLDALQDEPSMPGVASADQAATDAESATKDEKADPDVNVKLEKKISEAADKAASKINEKIKKLNDPEVSRKIEEEATKFAENVQRAAEQLGKILEERIQKDVKPALANIPSFLEHLPFVGNVLFGSTITTEEEYAGELTGDEIEVCYTGRNGFLEIKPWDVPAYRLEVKKTVQGPKAEELKNVKAFDVSNESGRLELRVKSEIIAGVNGTLWLPRDKSYSLRLHTSNGWMRIQGLKGNRLQAQTSNGRVEIRGWTGEQMGARTSNGSIECTDVIGNEVELETSNGRISASMSAKKSLCRTSNGPINLKLHVASDALTGEGRHEVTTSNGAIKISLPQSVLERTSVDARTSYGNVTIDAAELAVKRNGEDIGDRHTIAEGAQYESTADRVNIVARTSNAGITVTRLEE